MATAVLRPTDCLKPHRRPPTIIPHRRKPPSPAAVPRPPPPNSRGKRPPRSDGGKPSILHQAVVKVPSRHLVMEEVKILKRGEETRPLFAAASDLPVSVDLPSDSSLPAVKPPPIFSMEPLGPDPEILMKITKSNPVYAGPAFVMSPSPSSVPFPASFLNKSTETSATNCLRYLLGI